MNVIYAVASAHAELPLHLRHERRDRGLAYGGLDWRKKTGVSSIKFQLLERPERHTLRR